MDNQPLRAIRTEQIYLCLLGLENLSLQINATFWEDGKENSHTGEHQVVGAALFTSSPLTILEHISWLFIYFHFTTKFPNYQQQTLDLKREIKLISILLLLFHFPLIPPPNAAYLNQSLQPRWLLLPLPLLMLSLFASKRTWPNYKQVGSLVPAR